MKPRFFDSLKTQLIFFIIVSITFSTGIVASVIIYLNYENTLNQMKVDGLSIAKSNAAIIMDTINDDNSKESIQNGLAELAESQKLEYCALINEKCVDVYDSAVEEVGQLYDDDDTKKAVKDKKEVAAFWTDENGKKILDIMVPMDVKVGNERIALMDIGLSIDGLNKTIANSIVKNIIISLISIIFFSFVILLFVDRKIIKPINKIVDTAEVLSKGDVNVSFDLTCKGELGKLLDSFKVITNRIKEQAIATQMISDGKFDIEIQAASKDDVFSQSLIAMKNTLNDIIYEMNRLIREIINGNLSTRANEENYNGNWKELIHGTNQLTDALVFPLKNTAGYIESISRGNIPAKISDDYPGDFNTIKTSINGCIDAMDNLIRETAYLTAAVTEGKLDTRGDSTVLNGSWGELVIGINGLIDAFVAPLSLMADYMEQIGKGEIPDAIRDSYSGDFNKIRNCINACIQGLGLLVEEKEILTAMSNNDFSMQINEDFPGIYGETSALINQVGRRVNRTIKVMANIADGDLSDLDGLKEQGKKCEKDTLIPALILMIETIDNLYSETDIIWRAAMEGRLDFRGEEKKFEGKFKEIIEGINETLDAVTAPITEALAVLQELARGNLSVTMTGDYRGDHAELKNSLNETIQHLQDYISDISSILSEIGNGNLNLAVTADYNGDFVEIKYSLNNIIASLNQILGSINEAAEQVAIGSRQVSDGSQALSQGSTEQAGALEELTASISEVASQTKANAVNANQASALANTAKDYAVKGNEKMNEMLKSMMDIGEASTNISKIIKVIDDIAFQTNILALNAAVEAARAGQHGKGFAVVAEEVRNLAARSADAAKETTDLIEGSIKTVQSGTQIANETASALNEIVGGIEQSADLIGTIASASNE